MVSNHPLDTTRIRWVETVSGSKVKVHTASVVKLDYGKELATEPALEISIAGGGSCVIPLRAIARIDYEQS
jgi:hypothetical protein